MTILTFFNPLTWRVTYWPTLNPGWTKANSLVRKPAPEGFWTFQTPKTPRITVILRVIYWFTIWVFQRGEIFFPDIKSSHPPVTLPHGGDPNHPSPTNESTRATWRKREASRCKCWMIAKRWIGPIPRCCVGWLMVGPGWGWEGWEGEENGGKMEVLLRAWGRAQ